MMKSSFVLMGFILLVNPLSAQKEHRGEKGHGRMMPDSAHVAKMVEDITVELGLTEKQAAQFKQLHLAHFKEMSKKVEASKEDREKQREEMDAFRKEFESRVEALLTEEQKVKLKELHSKRRSPREGALDPKCK